MFLDITGEIEEAVVRKSLDDILGSTRLMSVGTVCDDGTPWLHNAYFSRDEDLFLYFLSSPQSQHSQNLQNSGGRTAVTVADTRQPGTPGTRRGVQFRGGCGPARGARLARGADLFAEAFPQFADVARALKTGPGAGPLLYAIEVDAFKLFDEDALGREVWLSGRVRPGRAAAPARTGRR